MAMNKEELKAYQKKYHATYKLHRKLERLEREANKQEDEQVLPVVKVFIPIIYTGTAEQTCSHFGCGIVLTPEQKLYGSKCTKHSGTPKETVSNYLMSKIKKQ